MTTHAAAWDASQSIEGGAVSMDGGPLVPDSGARQWLLDASAKDAGHAVDIESGLGDADGAAGADNARPPSALPGLVLWLDAARGVTASGLGGNPTVSQWKDGSGYGNHAVQSEVAKQPRLLPGAVNSLPAVQFNGHQTSLLIPSPADFALDTGDFTIELVAAWDNSTDQTQSSTGESWGYAVLISRQLQTATYDGFALWANGDVMGNGHPESRLFFATGDTSAQTYVASTSDHLNDGRFRLYCARRFKSTTLELRVDGVMNGQVAIPSTKSAAAPGADIFIGGHPDPTIKQSLSGAISEIAIIQGAVSDAELAQLEAYFNRKYQLWK